MRRTDGDKPATKQDLDELEAHIVGAIAKTLEENYPTKQDLKQAEQNLGKKIDNLSADVSGLRNRVIDVELKTALRPTHA